MAVITIAAGVAAAVRLTVIIAAVTQGRQGSKWAKVILQTKKRKKNWSCLRRKNITISRVSIKIEQSDLTSLKWLAKWPPLLFWMCIMVTSNPIVLKNMIRWKKWKNSYRCINCLLKLWPFTVPSRGLPYFKAETVKVPSAVQTCVRWYEISNIFQTNNITFGCFAALWVEKKGCRLSKFPPNVVRRWLRRNLNGLGLKEIHTCRCCQSSLRLCFCWQFKNIDTLYNTKHMCGLLDDLLDTP